MKKLYLGTHLLGTLLLAIPGLLPAQNSGTAGLRAGAGHLTAGRVFLHRWGVRPRQSHHFFQGRDFP